MIIKTTDLPLQTLTTMLRGHKSEERRGREERRGKKGRKYLTLTNINLITESVHCGEMKNVSHQTSLMKLVRGENTALVMRKRNSRGKSDTVPGCNVVLLYKQR